MLAPAGASDPREVALNWTAHRRLRTEEHGRRRVTIPALRRPTLPSRPSLKTSRRSIERALIGVDKQR